MSDELQVKRAEISDIDSRIAAALDRSSDTSRTRLRNELTADLQASESTLQSLRRDEAALRQRQDTVRENATDAKAALRNTEEQLSTAQAQVETRRQELRDLEGAAESPLQAFGGLAVVRFLAAVEKETGWHDGKPVGPMGRYIRVKDAKCLALFESVIGKTLNSFLVSNRHDRDLALRIANRVKL